MKDADLPLNHEEIAALVGALAVLAMIASLIVMMAWGTYASIQERDARDACLKAGYPEIHRRYHWITHEYWCGKRVNGTDVLTPVDRL